MPWEERDDFPPYAVVPFPKDLPPFYNMYNSSHANMSFDEYIFTYRGPQYLPIKLVIPITVVYTIIFITGILGNALVCIVIWKNTRMQTATNYYLFSLAVSDLSLLLLGLPNDLQIYWQQYPWRYGLVACKVRAVISESCSYSSVLTIVAFSFERYMAVCQPFHTYQISTLARAKWVILTIWIVSFICALPLGYYTSLNYLRFPPDIGKRIESTAFCGMFHEDYVKAILPMYETSTVIFFTVPMFILAVLYTLITIKLIKRDNEEVNRNREGVTKKPTLRMLGAVVVAFFLCWAPFHVQRLVFLYMIDDPNYQIINEWLYYITGCFYYFSATVNPLLYSLMSVKFRKAFRQTLHCNEHRHDVEQPRELRPTRGMLQQRFGRERPSGGSIRVVSRPVQEVPVIVHNYGIVIDIENDEPDPAVPVSDNDEDPEIDTEGLGSNNTTILSFEHETASRDTSLEIDNGSEECDPLSVFGNSRSTSGRVCDHVALPLHRSFSETIPIQETLI